MSKTQSKISRFTLFLALFTVSLSMSAQLSEKDKRYLSTVRDTLQLSAEQVIELDKVYLFCKGELDKLQNEVDSLERYEESESLLNLKVNVLNQKKKDAKEQRELDTRGVLTVEQKLVYETKIKPQKPKVLHFGIHDRAKCNVCIK
ncbi:MAG: hypothetical protein ACI84C_001261 [Flavobacteriales bacterium]|jgi:hypothetical protein